MRRPSAQAVHAALKELGVSGPTRVNPCLKRAIQTKFVKLDAETGLDKVVFEGQCIECDKINSPTVRDLLYQTTYAGTDYEEGGEGASIKCDCYGEDGGVGLYVTNLCQGQPQFDSGKFHNHCTKCPGFGTCIGDYRSTHCNRCKKHYFQGSMGDFKCDCRQRGRGGRFGGRRGDDCAIM